MAGVLHGTGLIVCSTQLSPQLAFHSCCLLEFQTWKLQNNRFFIARAVEQLFIHLQEGYMQLAQEVRFQCHESAHKKKFPEQLQDVSHLSNCS
eukprot:374632-Amphidinium_carterae.1